MEDRQLSPSGPEPKICEIGGSGQGLILPLLGDTEAAWPDGLQAVLYLFGLLWCFMGVAIIADVFMGAIEKITSRKIHMKDPVTGTMVTKKVWNDTVANLTLMALGSSAPEILLNVKEIFENKFYAGALGPSTIVGSAAFNLLVIIAVCVSALPDGDTRLIKDLGVYSITATFSIFAYLWLLVILLLISKDRVEVWEGLLTFAFFPCIVFTAFLADKGKLPGTKKPEGTDTVQGGVSKQEVQRRVAEIKEKYGEGLSDDQVAALIDYHYPDKSTHSRAFHRVAATRALFKGKKVKDANFEKGKRLSVQHRNSGVLDASANVVRLEKNDYVVLESAGTIKINVLRQGKDSSGKFSIKYQTVDGEAKAGSDYEAVSGILEFGPHETASKSFEVKIFQSHETEDPEDFFVELVEVDPINQDVAIMKGFGRARVMIIDENHPGKLSFFDDPPERIVPRQEKDQNIQFKVLRKRGCDGVVGCTVITEADTAMAGTDFEALEDKLIFKQGETEKKFEVKILGKKAEGQSETFRIILKDPENGVMFDATTDGGADCCVMTVMIQEPRVNAVFSILQVNHDQLQLGHTAWREQFSSAMCCNGSHEDEQEATVTEWVIHFIALPWKLFFALVPPTEYFGGWLCFFVALAMIAVVTILIGDLATMFGCALGISNFATAITFVALGTSLPDTFASKTAAVQDDCADASVGNVTGSNSVNVFLGLGLPWLIGAIYWQITGASDEWAETYPDMAEKYPGGGFIVKSDGLGLSVAVFSACSVVCIMTLAAKRKFSGAELGGNKKTCYMISAFFFSLWLIYIIVSIASDESS